jgi:hypothetical protein
MNPRRTLISKENTIGAAIGALALGANAAQADSGLFYFGAGITTLCCKGMITPNINSASWKVFAGFRPISQFAVEVDYYDLVPYDFCLRKYLPLLSLGCEGFREFRGGILPVPCRTSVSMAKRALPVRS